MKACACLAVCLALASGCEEPAQIDGPFPELTANTVTLKAEPTPGKPELHVNLEGLRDVVIIDTDRDRARILRGYVGQTMRICSELQDPNTTEDAREGAMMRLRWHA
jgi:hypothetical protein